MSTGVGMVMHVNCTHSNDQQLILVWERPLALTGGLIVDEHCPKEGNVKLALG